MKKISNFNLISLMIIILFTTIYGEGIYVIIKGAGTDSYISILLSIIISLPFLYNYNFICSFNCFYSNV